MPANTRHSLASFTWDFTQCVIDSLSEHIRALMRKLFWMLLLTALSCGAMADWVQVGSDETVIVYADPTSIEKDSNDETRTNRHTPVIIKTGKKVKMWSQKNFISPQVLYSNGNLVKTVNDKTLMSGKEQMEYDCKNVQYRLLNISYFSEKNGQGGVVYKDAYPDAAWRLIAPGSIVESLWKIACGNS
jgi:hypothetical protein